MENKINIAEILRNCPQGMELYSPLCGKCVFDRLNMGTIICKKQNTQEIIFTSEGYYMFPVFNDCECVLFPSKDQRDWSKFQRPFKDGDIIFTHANCLKVGLGNTWISIFQEKRNGGVATYVDYAEDGSGFYVDEDKGFLCMNEDIMCQRLATEEEKEKLFKAIKDNGYRWISEPKTLEKLIAPKFNVGDKIVHKIHRHNPFVITEITEQSYKGGIYEILIEQQDNFELVPDKFDLNTLKPFESRVLVRNSKDQYWIPAFWGYKAKDGYVTTFGHSIYCIPFEGNEHLLKTKNDCDKYFKTWE